MEAPGRAPQRILCAPTPRSWQVDVSHQRCSPSEQLHVIAAQRSVGLSSPHSTHLHAGWATIGGRPGAWGHGRARCRPSRQSALTSEQPSTLPSPSCMAGQRGWPGTWMVMIGLTRHPNQQSPTFRATADTAPHHPPEWAEGFGPPGRQSGTRSGCCPSMQFSPPVRCAG